MATASVVQSIGTNGSTAATNITVNLPSGLVIGNTLLLCVRKAAGTQTNPTDWTELANSSADASDDNILVSWKEVVGGEGSTVTVNGGSSAKFAARVWEINAADPSTNPPEITAIATGTDTAPDSASLTPSGGSNDYLYMSVGGWEGEQTSPPTYPTNYTHGQGAADSGTAGAITTNCRVAGAGRQLTASTSENPGAYTISASDNWMIFTLAFYPVSVPAYGWFQPASEPPQLADEVIGT